MIQCRTLLDCPIPILKMIAEFLHDERSYRYLTYTCSKLFNMYTMEQRYDMYYRIKTTDYTPLNPFKCPTCKLIVYQHRYTQHVAKCVANLTITPLLECKNCNTITKTPIHMPWYLKELPCPFFKCVYCNEDTCRQDKHLLMAYSYETLLGCKSCKMYVCKAIYCFMCSATYAKCEFNKHICVTKSLKKLHQFICQLTDVVYTDIRLTPCPHIFVRSTENSRIIMPTKPKYVQFLNAPPLMFDSSKQLITYIDVYKLNATSSKNMNRMFIDLIICSIYKK